MRSLLFPMLALCVAPAFADIDAQPKAEIEPTDPETFISRAVWAEQRLWVLTDHGHLTSLREDSKNRDEGGITGRVLDICRTPAGVAALACVHDECKSWVLRGRRDGAWDGGIRMEPRGDTLIALHCDEDSAVAITHRRAIDARRPHKALLFGNSIPASVTTTTFLNKQYIFVGINAGEWGGGLLRIDRATGAVEKIRRNESGELCGGPLNYACDPVNAIIAAPGKPGCVLAAIGLVHFESHGRIVEVCGRSVREFYSTDCTLSFGEGVHSIDMTGTDAFFGLARVGGELAAAGLCGVYRFSGESGPRLDPLPEFHPVDGVWVNFELRGLVMVMTNINRRRAVSGLTPLLVPR